MVYYYMRRDAGVVELADTRDLKSRETKVSYRFKPGFRHQDIAEWSSLVARRAHNPKVVWFKSRLRNQNKTPKKPLFVRLFGCFSFLYTFTVSARKCVFGVNLG